MMTPCPITRFGSLLGRGLLIPLPDPELTPRREYLECVERFRRAEFPVLLDALDAHLYMCCSDARLLLNQE